MKALVLALATVFTIAPLVPPAASVDPFPASAFAASGPPQVNCVARIAKGLSPSQGFRSIRYKVRGNSLSVSGISSNIAIARKKYMRGAKCWMGKSGGKTFGICQRSRDILAFYGAGVQLSPTSVKFANCY